MRKDTRKITIRQSAWEELSVEDRRYFQGRPMLLEYKGRKCFLSAGVNDTISLHRIDSQHTLVLSMNSALVYAGIEVVDLGEDDFGVSDDMFSQDVCAEIDDRIFDRSRCSVADILYATLG